MYELRTKLIKNSFQDVTYKGAVINYWEGGPVNFGGGLCFLGRPFGVGHNFMGPCLGDGYNFWAPFIKTLGDVCY